ncbi:MAG: NDP-sugar synthase [Chitinophagales bacterium]
MSQSTFRSLKGTKAMILAAGLGTRFKPWTDKHPKALALVNGKSLLQRNIEWLQRYGISEIIVNVHHFASQVISAIELNKGWGAKVEISDESDEVLETGGGLMKAGWFFDRGPFILVNADILTDLSLAGMMDQHKKEASLATLATTKRETSRYFLFDEQHQLCGWRNAMTGEEKGAVLAFSEEQRKKMSQRAFSGIHIIDPILLNKCTRVGKFSMVDLYLDLSNSEKISSYDHSGSKLVDVGKPESVPIAESLFP